MSSVIRTKNKLPTGVGISLLALASILISLVSISTDAKAQYTLRQCTALMKQTNEAMKQRAITKVISLTRHQLTYCKDTVGTDGYVYLLSVLAMGLNGNRQHSEALAVAIQCLQANSKDLGCAVEKGSALLDLKRPREAKVAVERALNYPAITESDVTTKQALRSLLESINLELRSQPTPPAQERKTARYGSGFFVTDASHIVTNSHVVKNCGSLSTANGTPLRLVRANELLDLAVLQAIGIKPPAVAAFRQTDAALGESIIVFGFPLAGLLSTAGNVTTGTVSAISGIRDNPHNLQITAPVQPGNSGGPLLDQFGNVVGIVVAKLDAIKAASVIGDIPQNVNFAIKGREVGAFLFKANIAPTISKASTQLTTEAVAVSAASFALQIVCR